MPNLQDYKKKRSSKSPEPGLSDSQESTSARTAVFVIQEHDASSHHYDFRLQVGDVLKSWAIPKGPSTDPREKRLMIETEDHPLDYADFEGVIPEGHYGAGNVIVWDTGTYQHRSEKDGEELDFEQARKSGHISVFLQGEKLTGGYEIIKMTGKNWSGDHWLLKKTDDDQADARRNPTSTEPESVLSGVKIDEVGQDGNDG